MVGEYKNKWRKEKSEGCSRVSLGQSAGCIMYNVMLARQQTPGKFIALHSQTHDSNTF